MIKVKEVAFSDAHLDAHENYLISKVAGLLHGTHGEYIAAKMRAREALNESLAARDQPGLGGLLR